MKLTKSNAYPDHGIKTRRLKINKPIDWVYHRIVGQSYNNKFTILLSERDKRKYYLKTFKAYTLNPKNDQREILIYFIYS